MGQLLPRKVVAKCDFNLSSTFMFMDQGIEAHLTETRAIQDPPPIHSKLKKALHRNEKGPPRRTALSAGNREPLGRGSGEFLIRPEAGIQGNLNIGLFEHAGRSGIEGESTADRLGGAGDKAGHGRFSFCKSICLMLVIYALA